MQPQPQPESKSKSDYQSREERLFFNSLSSDFTKRSYKVFMNKYLQIVGYKDLSELLAKQPKEIENDLIDFIISLKDRGCKHSTIINYVKPVLGCCKVNDIVLNVDKVNRFMPKYVRNKTTRAYENSEIQAMLDVADERLKVVIHLACCGLRIGSIPDLSIGSYQGVSVPASGQDLYKISVYEGEPEAYVTFCTSECRKAIDAYLDMRSRYGEELSKNHPLVREQFDRRDPFAVAHPRRIQRITLRKKLRDGRSSRHKDQNTIRGWTKRRRLQPAQGNSYNKWFQISIYYNTGKLRT